MNHQIRSIAPISEASPARDEPSGADVSGAMRRGTGEGGAVRGGIVEHRSATCAPGPGDAEAGRLLPVRGRRVSGRDVQRVRRVDRRPLVGRPGGAPVRYDRVRVAPRRRPHAPSPAVRVERAQVGFATLAVAALVTALFVVTMLLLAQWRSGAPDPAAPSHYGLTESPHPSERVSPVAWMP
ncbi:hypothetical protein [Nocardia shimofusensis]|uniref:hypothetical protein n=1 Tax=Nocardia shimofusensis TaxID=228596 RepID=UPI000A64B9BA|nr:hypothetical protein [Nocardia shimofusensis]